MISYAMIQINKQEQKEQEQIVNGVNVSKLLELLKQ